MAVICGQRKGAMTRSLEVYDLKCAGAVKRTSGRSAGVERGDRERPDRRLGFASPRDKIAGFVTLCSILMCMETLVPMIR